MTKLTSPPRIKATSFQDLWKDLDRRDLQFDAKKIKVAVDLAALVAQSGLTRSALGVKLGWKPSRVTKVLSGRENLTLETIATITFALTKDFDIVFRRPSERESPQSWNRNFQFSLQGMEFEEFAPIELRRARAPAANDEVSPVSAAA